MTYEIKEHKHRYAAWAASRASSVKGCRFSVLQGKMIIENSGLSTFVDSPQNLPETNSFDKVHSDWRESVILQAEKLGLNFTHGVAAKLINVYMKTIFVCGGYAENEKVAPIHPPIDGLLLKSLRDNDVGGLKKEWRKAVTKRWSKFDSDEYQSVIDNIRKALNGSPMWKIEKYWQGYQGSTAIKSMQSIANG